MLHHSPHQGVFTKYLSMVEEASKSDASIREFLQYLENVLKIDYKKIGVDRRIFYDKLIKESQGTDAAGVPENRTGSFKYIIDRIVDEFGRSKLKLALDKTCRAQNIRAFITTIQGDSCYFCEEEITTQFDASSEKRPSILISLFNTSTTYFPSESGLKNLQINEHRIVPLIDPRQVLAICPSCFRQSRFLWNPYDKKNYNYFRPGALMNCEATSQGILCVDKFRPKAERDLALQLLTTLDLNSVCHTKKRKMYFRETFELIREFVNNIEEGRSDGIFFSVSQTIYDHLSPRAGGKIVRRKAIERVLYEKSIRGRSLFEILELTDLVTLLINCLEAANQYKEFLPDILQSGEFAYTLKELDIHKQDLLENFENEKAQIKTLVTSKLLSVIMSALRNRDINSEPRDARKEKIPPRTLKKARHNLSFIWKFQITNYKGLNTEEIIVHHKKYESYIQANNTSIQYAALLADNAGGKTRCIQALALALATERDLKAFDEKHHILSDAIHEGPALIKVWFLDQPENYFLMTKIYKKKDSVLVVEKGVFELLGDNKEEQIDDFFDSIAFVSLGANRAIYNDSSVKKNGECSEDANGLNQLTRIFSGAHNLPNPKDVVQEFLISVSSENLESDERDISDSAIKYIEMEVEFFLRNCGSGDIVSAKVDRNNHEIFLLIDGEEIRSCRMSDGYKALLYLCISSMLLLRGRIPSQEVNGPEYSTSGAGIVLIDELDAHLHPKRRRSLVSALRMTFPNVQYIFTTHDPLILRGMPASSVFRIEPPGSPEQGISRFETLANSEFLDGYEIDELLVSEIFGLDSTRGPSDQADFQRYLHLLRTSSHDSGAKNELVELRRRFGSGMGGMKHPADSILFPAIDRIYADAIGGDSAQEEEAVSEEEEAVSEEEEAVSKKEQAIRAVKELLVQLWDG